MYSWTDDEIRSANLAYIKTETAQIKDYIHSDAFLEDIARRIDKKNTEGMRYKKYKEKYEQLSADYDDLTNRFDLAMSIIKSNSNLIQRFYGLCEKAENDRSNKRKELRKIKKERSI